jgi:hypothetical protein
MNRITAGLAAALCASVAHSAEIVVSPGVSIQSSIASAANGDTIRVLPGTYGGFSVSKSVYVRGQPGAILSSGVEIDANDCAVEGFRIRNAGFTASGPLNNVKILRNHTGPSDYHCWIVGDNWLVEGNEFERVVYSGSGDADYMRIFGTGHVVRRNFFHGTKIPGDLVKNDNYSHTDGIQFYANNGDILRDCVIEQNWFTHFFQGLFLSDEQDRDSIQNVTVRDNVFWGTEFERGGAFLGRPSWGVLFGKHHGGRSIVVERNIIYNCVNYLAFRGTMDARIGGNVIAGRGGGTTYILRGNSADNIQNTGNALWMVSGYGNFYNDVIVNPLFANEDDPLGPDGKPFTADDGARPQLRNYGPNISEWSGAAPSLSAQGDPVVED